MAAKPQLDYAGGSGTGRVTLISAVLLILAAPAFAQDHPSDVARMAAAQSAFDAAHWEEAARLARGPANQPPELDLLNGLALARLEKWDEASLAFEAGARKSPRDSRFPVELAGVAYKHKDIRTAKRHLHRALFLNPQDGYAHEFLATIFFIEGNLEAALKYWNPEGKPQLRNVAFAPPLHLKEPLRTRALAFNAPQVLTGDALLTTEARLDALEVFSSRRIELTPASSESYDLTLHLAERNHWGDSKLEGVISLLSGLPYATLYPGIYNLGHRAINLTSLARWDSEKRRVSLQLSMPLYGNPALRLRIFADARNENWNLSRTFLGAGVALTDLNMRRAAGGAEIRDVVNGRWSWTAGAEISNRNFRNLPTVTSSSERVFFTDSTALSGWLGFERSLLRLPERRFTLEVSAEARAGREFARVFGPFAAIRGAFHAHWFPRSKGDDYEMNAQVRAGDLAGKATLDELFQLGVERDNDLWLRGHAGTLDGRKGAAPLGRRYFLANWEMDKNIYRNGFFTVKLGPFLDSGAIADSSAVFGSQRWLWDSGVQCKVKILSGVTVAFSYGRDLHGGKGVFYGTVLHPLPGSQF